MGIGELLWLFIIIFMIVKFLCYLYNSVQNIFKRSKEYDKMKKEIFNLKSKIYIQENMFKSEMAKKERKLEQDMLEVKAIAQQKIKNMEETTKITLKNLELEEKAQKEEIEFIKKNLEVEKEILNYKLSPFMLKIYNDFYEKHLTLYQNYFTMKKNPSYKSADYIKEIKTDYKDLQIKNRRLELLLSQFLEEKEDETTEKEKQNNSFDTEEIAYRYSRISKEEWKKLSYIERLDLIVQRYREKWKDKLNIGLEFERYCGYLYEKNGYTVEYNGILKGKSDGGIDLIATNKNKKIYIQCKYWSMNKQIRENTITQLFGSALKKAIDDGENYNTFIEKINSEKIRIVLLTKTELSEEAKLFCSKLNVLYKENIKINSNYPIVKGVYGEEKIFYIPTDLQYDIIKYKSTYKEYCRFETCKDAEKAGYRHCYKWKGDKS